MMPGTPAAEQGGYKAGPIRLRKPLPAAAPARCRKKSCFFQIHD